MSGKKIAVTAGVLAGAAALGLWWAGTSPPPIIISDGSVTMQYESISKNSPTEIEAYKPFHKVYTITVKDHGTPVASVPVKGKEWYLTSVNPQVRFDLRSHFGKGVAGTCPSTWQDGATYVCNGDKLTPATLTFTDGSKCPLNQAVSCPLSCTSGYCTIEFEYKLGL